MRLVENTDYNNLAESVYNDYVPYSFIYTFKCKIFKTACDVKCSENIDSEKYISYFTDCVFELPDDNFFLEFNDLFCEFTMNLNLINDAGEFDKY